MALAVVIPSFLLLLRTQEKMSSLFITYMHGLRFSAPPRDITGLDLILDSSLLLSPTSLFLFGSGSHYVALYGLELVRSGLPGTR